MQEEKQLPRENVRNKIVTRQCTRRYARIVAMN